MPMRVRRPFPTVPYVLAVSAALAVAAACSGDSRGKIEGPESLPDFQTPNVAIVGSFAAGRPVVISWAYRNGGTSAGGAAAIHRFYLVPVDSNTTMHPLGEIQGQDLQPGAAVGGRDTFSVPLGTHENDYWILMELNATGSVRESSTSNNRQHTQPANHLKTPDLVFTTGGQVALAFSRDTGVIRIAGGRMPRWSPAGDQIAFVVPSGENGGVSELVVVNRDGSNPHTVFSTRADFWYPAWSPDGRRIAFVSNMNGVSGLYVLDLSSHAASRIYTGVRAERVDWSVTDRIAFVTGTGTLASERVMAVSPAGGSAVQLTPGGEPAWSPNGRQLAYARYDRSGRPLLSVLDLGDGTSLDTDIVAYSMTWSRESGMLIYSMGGSGGLGRVLGTFPQEDRAQVLSVIGADPDIQ